MKAMEKEIEKSEIREDARNVVAEATRRLNEAQKVGNRKRSRAEALVSYFLETSETVHPLTFEHKDTFEDEEKVRARKRRERVEALSAKDVSVASRAMIH